MRHIILIALVFCVCINSAQEASFKPDQLARHLRRELNAFRLSKNLDTVELLPRLQDAAELSAQDLADNESEKAEPEEAYKYLKTVGLSNKGNQLTAKSNVFNGKEEIPALEVAKTIFQKWQNTPKTMELLRKPKVTLAGVNGCLDEEGEKVYVSMFLAGYDSFNDGPEHKKELKVAYNTVSKSLKPGDERGCATCRQWKKYDLLHNGLYVKDKKVYLRYADARELRAFMKKPKDGIAMEVVQRSQFNPSTYNIIDNNLYQKGVMGKIFYKDKFFSANRLKSKDKKVKVKAIEVEMGKLDPNITEPYELNLLIIQNGKACKTITRSYVERGESVTEATPVGLLPYPVDNIKKSNFDPRNESSILNFIIPFEKNKAEFKQEDIQPFLKALNEPDFIIDGVYIYAYSSIEGDSVANKKLQQKRAESVVTSLQQMQSKKITPSIYTRDSWGLFLLENEDTKYGDLVALGRSEAVNKINSDKKLLQELEPVLAKGRFAQIILDVTYDTKGEKEQRFAAMSLNKALRAKDEKNALKILDFITKRINEGKYPVSLYDSIETTVDPKTVAVLNQFVYSKYQSTGSITMDDNQLLQELKKFDPTHPVLQFNSLFSWLTVDTANADPKHQAEVQQQINDLYGRLDSAYVNGLNIQWQFRILESLDTLPGSEMKIAETIERIKKFYKIKDASWQNSLKLAKVFMRAKLYHEGCTLLEPHLNVPSVDEDLIFTYLSCAGHDQERFFSRKFAQAMELAQARNKERSCKLVGEPYLSFQVLENPGVKKIFRQECN